MTVTRIGHDRAMGTLVPVEFPMSSLKNGAERVVVQTLVDRLTDGWLVLPSVGLADADRDRDGRRGAPPRPLARDHRPVRHDHRRRGTGLPPRLDRPPHPAARPRRTTPPAPARRHLPGGAPRGFEVPPADDGWTRAEFTDNCRNTFGIASFLHQRFDAAVAPVGGPESEDVRWIEASDLDAISDAVGDALDRLEDRDHAAATVLVATIRSPVRDQLRDEFAFVSWDDGDPMAIVCENVHRIKGLEYDHVVLVAYDPDKRVPDDLLYVGASRAVMSLTVIGPPEIGTRLDISDRL